MTSLPLSLQEYIATERRIIKNKLLQNDDLGSKGIACLTSKGILQKGGVMSPWSDLAYQGSVCPRHAMILGDYVKARFYEKAGDVIGDTFWDDNEGTIYIGCSSMINSEEELQGYSDIISWSIREALCEVQRWHMRGAIEEIFTVRDHQIQPARHTLTSIEVTLDANDANDRSVTTKIVNTLSESFPSIGEEAEKTLKELMQNKKAWLYDLIREAMHFVRFSYSPLQDM